MKVFSLGLVLAVAFTSQAVTAQERSFGQTEYMNSCAQCHGADGTGGGPMAGYLTGSLPDLTQIQKNNDGVFPISAIYQMIEGTDAMGPHGTREMPAWGHRYSVDAEDQIGFDFGMPRETYVRNRVLALVEYLASMQAE